MVILQFWFNLNMWTATNTTILFLRIMLFAVVRVMFAVVSKVPVDVGSTPLVKRLRCYNQLHGNRVCHQPCGDSGIGIHRRTDETGDEGCLASDVPCNV